MDERETLAEECKRLAQSTIGYQPDGQHTRELLYAAIDRLAAIPKGNKP